MRMFQTLYVAVFACGIGVVGTLYIPSMAGAQEASTATALPERTQARVVNLASNMANRMDATVLRMERIAARMNARIDMLESEGLDMAAANTSLTRARDTLTQVKRLLVGIDAKIRATATSNTPKEAWPELRATFAEIKILLIRAHTELRITLTAIKNPGSPIEPIATSTPNTNATTSTASSTTP